MPEGAHVFVELRSACIVPRYGEGYKHAVIAEKLNLKPNTVRKTCKLHGLRRLLAPPTYWIFCNTVVPALGLVGPLRLNQVLLKRIGSVQW
jgi:hypothetical protein